MFVPSWYDSSECGVLRFANADRAAAAGAEYGRTHQVRKCQKWQDDDEAIVLSVIDCQNDFVCPDGSLFFPGAVEDKDRLHRLI